MNKSKITLVTLAIFLFLTTLIGGCMWGMPKYRIYKQQLRGEAELREAEWTKKVLIETATARKDAAVMEAQAKITIAGAQGKAEIIRATATSEANTILGESLKGNEAYLRYLWIMGLHDGNSERIYIPTEANMPILEASALTK